jgi:hypothetical protein
LFGNASASREAREAARKAKEAARGNKAKKQSRFHHFDKLARPNRKIMPNPMNSSSSRATALVAVLKPAVIGFTKPFCRCVANR